MRASCALPCLFLVACSAAVEPSSGHPREENDTPPAQEVVQLDLACLVADPVVPAKRASAADPVDEALGAIGRTRATFGLTTEALSLSKLDTTDARVFTSTQNALRAPAELPSYGRAAASAFDAAGASDTPVTKAILVAAHLRETPVSACAPRGGSFDEALAELGGEPSEARSLDLDLKEAFAPILVAMKRAHDAIASSGSSTAAEQVPAWILGVRRFALDAQTPKTFESIDVARIAAAGASLALTIERAHLTRFAGRELPSLDLRTAMGPLIFRGPRADTFTATEAPAFLFDTGGDDVYRAPVAAATRARSVAILVDLGGNDTYGYVETEAGITTRLPSDAAGRHDSGRTLSNVGRQGSGVLGVGLLFDLGGGSDRYRSLVGSQGCGSHGVGVLFDDGGDDLYEAEGFSQGAAAWGVGLLLDRAGDDRYVLHNSGQGFGFTRGVGAIVDAAGNDTYIADVDGAVLYPADQLEGDANHSFAQGCGAGHRPDWPDPGFPFPGGLGILRDARGNDVYHASVFAQGCGFVEGLGALLDGAGDDRYDGLYYVQGTAAHVGAALFLEEGGDDRYDTEVTVIGPALGVGTDLSVATFFDAAGNDRYEPRWYALGAGLSNGAALFVDAGGDDLVNTLSEASLGVARKSDAPARKDLPSLGAFVKAGGEATYRIAGAPSLRRGQTWTFEGAQVEIGVGRDAPTGRVTF